jgi:hypothetical protein
MFEEFDAIWTPRRCGGSLRPKSTRLVQIDVEAKTGHAVLQAPATRAAQAAQNADAGAVDERGGEEESSHGTWLSNAIGGQKPTWGE